MTPPKVVIDASAVLAWVFNERNADVIDQLLPLAVIPSANLVEVLYRAVERGHSMSAQELKVSLLDMGLRVEPVVDEDIVRAAELIAGSRTRRGRGHGSGLSLGDGLCIAVAERRQLMISGGDQLWEQLDLRVEYLPFR